MSTVSEMDWDGQEDGGHAADGRQLSSHYMDWGIESDNEDDEEFSSQEGSNVEEEDVEWGGLEGF